MYKIAIIKYDHAGKTNYTEEWLQNELETQNLKTKTITCQEIFATDYIKMSIPQGTPTDKIVELAAETDAALTIATEILRQDVKLWLAEPEETAYHLVELIDQEMQRFQRQGQKFLRLYRIGNINSSIRGLKELEAKNIWIPTAMHHLDEWELFDTLRSYYYIGMGYSQFERILDTLLISNYGLEFTDHMSRRIIQGNRPGLYASLIITEAQHMHADTVLLNLDAWTYFVQELQLKFQQENNAKLVPRLHKILDLRTKSEIKNCALIKRDALGENTPCVVNLARFHITRLVTNIASQL